MIELLTCIKNGCDGKLFSKESHNVFEYNEKGEVVKKMHRRRVCEKCYHTFHTIEKILSKKEFKGIKPKVDWHGREKGH